MGFPFHDLQSTLAAADVKSLPGAIVNSPFKYKAEMVLLGIGIVVLLVADKESGQVHRVALSNTEMAEGTLRFTSKKFEDIKIPLNHAENIIIRAIQTQEPQMTDDWQYLFTPALSPGQARLNQAGGSIACSYVFPLEFAGNAGALIFSYFKEPDQINGDEHEFMAGYSKLVSDRLADAKADLITLRP
jgi:hypothetical protein